MSNSSVATASQIVPPTRTRLSFFDRYPNRPAMLRRIDKL